MAIKIVDVAPARRAANSVPAANKPAANKTRKQAYNPARRDYMRDYMRKRRAK